MLRSPPAGCPQRSPPRVLLSHQRLACLQGGCCGPGCAKAVLGGGGSLWPTPGRSDEPLLRGQLEVGGWWSTGTHLLLTAGPVGALCLALFSKFPHQQE